MAKLYLHSPEQRAIRSILHDELTRIRQRHPRYSLRSYARKLQLAPAALSQIMNGKRRVSRHLALTIAEHLALKPAARDSLRQLFDTVQESGPNAFYFTGLDLCRFRVVSDWWHFAVLSALELTSTKHDTESLAKLFNLPTSKIQRALTHLRHLELIERNATGSYQLTQQAFSSPDHITDAAIQKHHRQSLRLAERALEHIPVTQRDFTSLTMAIDPQHIDQAKQLTRQYLQKMAGLLESDHRSAVYKLSVQLFPLSKGHT